jgi:hypothetical protein
VQDAKRVEAAALRGVGDLLNGLPLSAQIERQGDIGWRWMCPTEKSSRLKSCLLSEVVQTRFAPVETFGP